MVGEEVEEDDAVWSDSFCESVSKSFCAWSCSFLSSALTRFWMCSSRDFSRVESF